MAGGDNGVKNRGKYPLPKNSKSCNDKDLQGTQKALTNQLTKSIKKLPRINLKIYPPNWLK